MPEVDDQAVPQPPAKVAKTEHAVVSDEEWKAARLELLEKEKALSKKVLELAAERRSLPWRLITKDYEFEGPKGKVSLAELFGDKEDLIVYHLMMEPGKPRPCDGCSFFVDQIESSLVHLRPRCNLVLIAKAPYAELEAAAAKKGWTAPIYSWGGTTFGLDFGVSFTEEQRASKQCPYNYNRNVGYAAFSSEAPGMSVFRKQPGEASGAQDCIYHTYSTYGAGLATPMTVMNLLDLTPTGRDEGGKGNGKGIMWWIKHKEDYVA